MNYMEQKITEWYNALNRLGQADEKAIVSFPKTLNEHVEAVYRFQKGTFKKVEEKEDDTVTWRYTPSKNSK